jgi:GT2 family glycosyltransferase
MTKVSIVTVTYNSSGNITRYLDGLAKNHKYISEVVIVDNNSHDQVKTQKICNTYDANIRLKFVKSGDNGFGTSSNYGVKFTSSDHILFLNPDTELKEESLQILTLHMKNSNADIIGGKSLNINGRVHGSVVRIPTLLTGIFEFTNLGKILNINKFHNQLYYKDLHILESNKDVPVKVVSGSYLLITRQAFLKLGGFDKSFYMYLEDVDLGKRAEEIGLVTYFCPHSDIMHEGGGSSNNMHKTNYSAWYKSRKYYFWKHFRFAQNLLIQPLFILEELFLKH